MGGCGSGGQCPSCCSLSKNWARALAARFQPRDMATARGTRREVARIRRTARPPWTGRMRPSSEEPQEGSGVGRTARGSQGEAWDQVGATARETLAVGAWASRPGPAGPRGLRAWGWRLSRGPCPPAPRMLSAELACSPTPPRVAQSLLPKVPRALRRPPARRSASVPEARAASSRASPLSDGHRRLLGPGPRHSARPCPPVTGSEGQGRFAPYGPFETMPGAPYTW